MVGQLRSTAGLGRVQVGLMLGDVVFEIVTSKISV
jgi:hypothetical protein